MTDIFNLSEFDSYREDNRIEVKKATEGLPLSLWETYSAFANCYGGIIILGVKENPDGSFSTTGLKNAAKLQKDFWSTINNVNKISINLLQEDDVKIYEHNGDIIMVIRVPMASRDQKPVYVNGNLFGGTFRRNFEGDYHCSRIQIKTMLRDQADDTIDMTVIDTMELDVLNKDSVNSYRNNLASLKSSHPFLRLEESQFLRSIGAATFSEKDKNLHPTAAGLLMFGNEYDIVRQFPNYFLDYQSIMDPSIRWVDRVQSSSGEWSGNVFDFYFRVYNKLIASLKIPFKTVEGIRIDDTVMHEALREALANCFVNADYYGSRGIVIKQMPDKLVLENPGYSRTGKIQMMIGGVSDPRNRGMMKMFNLIDIGERAGSGIPMILNAWKDKGYPKPTIKEEFDPDRTILTLPLEKKQAIKPLEDNSQSKLKTKKTLENESKILQYLKINGKSKCPSIAQYLGLSEARTRAILRNMPEVDSIDKNKFRYYRIK